MAVKKKAAPKKKKKTATKKKTKKAVSKAKTKKKVKKSAKKKKTPKKAGKKQKKAKKTKIKANAVKKPAKKAKPKEKKKAKPAIVKPAEPPAEKKPKPRTKLDQPVKLVGHPTSVIVFGIEIAEPKIRSAAIDAYRKRVYTTDDIHALDFFGDKKHDNLMVKIAILDRIQEMVILLYPNVLVGRKNKITLCVD